jgi:pyruvate/2-oxoacid:ferredoxin oxidoreductase beta subunit
MSDGPGTDPRYYRLPEHEVFCSGHLGCPGCAEALAVRWTLNTMGPRTVCVVPPSCIAQISGSYPLTSMRVPLYQPTLESCGAAASGISRALRRRGKDDVNVLVLAGDGGTYDIGIQSLSGAAERGEDMVYVCLDNEGYMNTGGQKSGSTPRLAFTASTPGGKPTPKKNIAEIMVGHRIPYVATATVGYPDDFARKVATARDMKGTRFILVLTPCIVGWGLPDDGVVAVSRLAVETGFFPLYEVQNGEAYSLSQTAPSLGVERYLQAQKRYRHLGDDQIGQIQHEVDREWRILQGRAGLAAC